MAIAMWIGMIERFKSVSASYLKGVAAAVVVFDLTRQETFSAVKGWLDELREQRVAASNIIVCGNKDDLALERQVRESDALSFAQRQGVSYLETSALTAHNVKEAFDILARRVCFFFSFTFFLHCSTTTTTQIVVHSPFAFFVSHNHNAGYKKKHKSCTARERRRDWCKQDRTD